MSDKVTALPANVRRYAKYLLIMSGLGGLLYGIDVGVIAAALPYIQETSTYTPQQLSVVVAAVLFGSVLSSLFAGAMAEALGRKKVILLSALCFVASIPVICFSNNNFLMLMGGRILQGASAGLVGVVVPMYLAECLDSDSRGKGTGMFQLLLTIGLAFAAAIGLAVTSFVGAADSAVVTDTAKTIAWQVIFWCSAVPGVILFFGAFKLKESPRWLYKRGRKDEAIASLAANNGEEKAREILEEMLSADAAAEAEKKAIAAASKGDSLFQRKYIIPFVLAVIILACNQSTGINSVLNYSVNIFQQAGLQGPAANWADFAIKIMNVLMTIVACALVDKKGRKFLLKLGTFGIIVGLCGVGGLFKGVETSRLDVTDYVKSIVKDGSWMKTSVEDVVKAKAADNAMFFKDAKIVDGVQLIVTYKQGNDSLQTVAEYFDRSKDKKALLDAGLEYNDNAMEAVNVTAKYEEFIKSLGLGQVARVKGDAKLSEKIQTGIVKVPEGRKDTLVESAQRLEKNSDRVIIDAAFANEPTFLDKICFWSESPKAGELKKIEINSAELGVKPGQATGWFVTLCFMFFIAFYAVGPGVCVWLALSELMPTRIRANGMAIAMIINQGVSTTIAGVFLPWVGACGYSSVFFCLAGFTVIYFITAAFFLPETKGRTLEEIEQYFKTGKMPEKKGA